MAIIRGGNQQSSNVKTFEGVDHSDFKVGQPPHAQPKDAGIADKAPYGSMGKKD